MSDQATADTLIKAIGAGSVGFGVVSTLAPGVLAATYGLRHDTPDMIYMGRMWGTRTAGLGALALVAESPEQKRLMALVATVLNAADTLAVLGTRGLPARTKVMAALTSGAFCAASVVALTSD